jgi:N-acyl-phosphatidylethanolamine-hydrolysing phospholipase D
MRSFFRSLFHRRLKQASQNPNVMTTTAAMSTGMTTALLYACIFSKPTSLGAVPEDSEAKAHHLKDGKGFANPWKSWRDMNGPQIMGSMLW